MSFAAKYHRESVHWDVDSKELKFIGMKDAVQQFGFDHVFRIDGVYVNGKSKFGEAPVIMCGEEGIALNAPKSEVDTVREIMHDSEAVAAIKAGKAGFCIYKYTNNYGKQLGIEYRDI